MADEVKYLVCSKRKGLYIFSQEMGSRYEEGESVCKAILVVENETNEMSVTAM